MSASGFGHLSVHLLRKMWTVESNLISHPRTAIPRQQKRVDDKKRKTEGKKTSTYWFRFGHYAHVSRGRNKWYRTGIKINRRSTCCWGECFNVGCGYDHCGGNVEFSPEGVDESRPPSKRSVRACNEHTDHSSPHPSEPNSAQLAPPNRWLMPSGKRRNSPLMVGQNLRLIEISRRLTATSCPPDTFIPPRWRPFIRNWTSVVRSPLFALKNSENNQVLSVRSINDRHQEGGGDWGICQILLELKI